MKHFLKGKTAQEAKTKMDKHFRESALSNKNNLQVVWKFLK